MSFEEEDKLFIGDSLVRVPIVGRSSDWVFSLEPDLANSWQSKEAGIQDLTFHDLRHTFASRLREAGVDAITRRDLLGQSSVEMSDGLHALISGVKTTCSAVDC